MKIDRITVRRFFDSHVHFRQLAALLAVIGYTARWCAYAAVQPNLKPFPVVDGPGVRLYEGEILAATKPKYPWFTPVMIAQIIPDPDINLILARAKSAFAQGVRIFKIFPKNGSNSNYGVSDYIFLYPVFAWMQEVGAILMLHGESPDDKLEFMEAEKKFIPIVDDIHDHFPNLKISVEHIGEKDMIDYVLATPNLYGGITLQHATRYMNHWGKQSFKNRDYCMPATKYRKDMEAVMAAAISNKPEYRKFRAASDTAPHTIHAKQAEGCCGCFSAPVLYQAWASEFDRHGVLDERFEDFTSTRSCELFGVPPSQQRVTLVRHEYVVEQELSDYEPFMLKETLGWQFEELVGVA